MSLKWDKLMLVGVEKGQGRTMFYRDFSRHVSPAYNSECGATRVSDYGPDCYKVNVLQERLRTLTETG